MVAQFAGSHGVRGEFKIRSYTENPLRLFSYGRLYTADGETLTPELIRETKPGVFLCRDPDITSPEACTRLKGQLLSVDRETLPDTDSEDDFYVADLIGLEARDEDGRVIGKVRAVENYGAGDIVEVKGKDGLVLVAFTKDAVPEVRLDQGFITIVQPVDEPNEDEDRSSL